MLWMRIQVTRLLLKAYLMPSELELLALVDETEDDDEVDELKVQLQTAARTQQCLAVFWSAYVVDSVAHKQAVLR